MESIMRTERTALIEKIGAIIGTAEMFRAAFFWTPPRNAGARRSYERKYSHDVIEWTEGGHSYSAAYDVRCSCANVYARGTYTRDGRPTTLTAIRNSYKRLRAADADEIAARMDAIMAQA